MATEETLVLVKPDGVARGLTGAILARIESKGYALVDIRLVEPDEYAAFNTGAIVYHDDVGDYSTNEYIMDGSASLAYLLATFDPSFTARGRR